MRYRCQEYESVEHDIVLNAYPSIVYSDIPESYALSVLGNNIRAARLAAGLTQVQLARKTRIAQSDISKFERTGRLSADQVQRIATACGVAVGDLYGPDASVSPQPPSSDAIRRLKSIQKRNASLAGVVRTAIHALNGVAVSLEDVLLKLGEHS